MKRIIKNNYKIIIGILIGILLSVTSVYAIDAYIESNKVSYDNKSTKKDNVQEAIDELYERSGIHQEKWIDPILNGADPILKEPLIPVEIKPNGDVYYANEKSEWYNYSEKRWANAVILNDNAKDKYTTGQKISNTDIKGYFVWIPRFSYKMWNEGNYKTVMTLSNLSDAQNTASAETALWRITGNSTRIIDVKFGSADKIAKMSESEAAVGEYYTHPAFTLGSKNLNGIWVGKFETGGTSANDMIVKPNVISWRGDNVKTFFDAARGFVQNLDSHMMKNTEWGAAAYLSHSQYGIGNEVNINNASDFYTGYSAAPNTDQSTYTGDLAAHTNESKTQPWNTPVGYLASTTGNISGVYDMSGGVQEYVAACVKDKVGISGFADANALSAQVTAGYIDEYPADSVATIWNNRILGDATGEMGPFYSYYENNGAFLNHSSWYGDYAYFVSLGSPWFQRGGSYADGVIAGQFCTSTFTGEANGAVGFRLILSPIN